MKRRKFLNSAIFGTLGAVTGALVLKKTPKIEKAIEKPDYGWWRNQYHEKPVKASKMNDLYARTLANRDRQIAEDIVEHNALLARLKS